MTTGQLEYFLEQEIRGRERYTLRTIFVICDILAERTPGNTAKEVFLRFCKAYADKKDL
jgi:hypothetical protein